MNKNTILDGSEKCSRFYNSIRKIRRSLNRKRLKNKDFSLISSNCNGALILHDLGLRFNSPFVNLWIRPKDFLKILSDLESYMAEDIIFVQEQGINYPIGAIKDVKIYFQHYKTNEEAFSKWNERKQRINYNNLYVMFTDRDGCTVEDLKAFDRLGIKHKVVFTHNKTNEIRKLSLY